MNREKVIKGLECLTGMSDCTTCPYSYNKQREFCLCDIGKDVKELLKEQEEDIQDLRRENHNILTQFHEWAKEQDAVEPFSDDDGAYWCGSCHEDIVWHQKFCSNCGKPVLWERR